MKKLLLSLVAMFGFTTAFAGTGTEADPYTVADIVAKGATASETGVFVKGYIVGSCTGKTFDTATFTATGASGTNIIIADAADVTDATLCVPVQLPAGNIRTSLNLSANPANLGRGITLGGDIAKYFNVAGIKNTDKYTWADGGTTPDTPVEPEGPVSFLNESFTTAIPSNWTQVNVAGNKDWYWREFGGVGYATMTGYNGTAPFDQWLVSPAVDMSKVTDKSLSFRTQVNGYGSTTSKFEVYVMTQSDTKGSNTQLNPTIAVAPTSGYSAWAESGSLDLSSYTGIIYIGFRYSATEDANYATWCVTDVKLGDATDTPVDPVEPTVETVDNISGFIAKASDAKPVVAINNTVTAVYQNGSYLYVKDATGWLLVYGKPAQYNNGDVIPAGITGTAALYNGAAQLSSPVAETFKEATSGAAVEPTTVLCEEISADMIHQYVLLKGVTIAAGSKNRNYTMTDASEVSVTLYQQFNDATKYDEVVTIPTGENYNVYGFVGLYNGTAQVLATKVVSATGKEIVATPTFSVAAGEVTEGTSVEITCATEGASIYYTLDGTEPTTASTLYAAAIVINEATTIKAIAVKDGMDNSPVVTAEYTIKAPFVPADNAAYFVAPQFTDVEGTKLINNDGSEKMADGDNDMKDETKSLVGKTFENNGVSLVFTHGDGQNYTIANGNQVRWYKGEIATITAPEGAAITKVFVQTVANSKGSFTANVGTVEGKGTSATTPITWTGNTTEPLVLTTEAQVRLSYIEVTFETESGIEDVEINNNAPVEYFNLQGVRVEEPTSGLYIRRQGNNVSKVVIR